MSIFKQSFPKWVKNQLRLRQDLQTTGIKGNLKSNEALVWEQSRQCVVRATSLVDYKEDIGLDISDGINDIEFNNLKGSQLAKKFILQGGILDKNQHRSATFGQPGSAYGDPLLGGNGGSEGFGQVPMPGITSLDIATKSAYGSLRQAKLSFVVHNLKQLEIMELLYLRPGYPVLVEWQWSPFIRSTNEIDNLEYRIEDSIIFPPGNGKIKQENIYNTIVNLKKTTEGNYDGFLGFVTNFGFQARADGGFDCYTEIVSMGEVLDSLKIPTSGHVLTKLTGKNFSFALNREDQDEPEEINNPDILRAILLAMAKFTGTVDTAGGEIAWTPQFYENWVNNESGELSSAVVGLIIENFPPFNPKGPKDNTYSTDEKLKKLEQYVLKKNTVIKGGENEGTFNAPINTGYIRWDLLAFLINQFVISKPEEDDEPPIKITTSIFRNDPLNNDEKVPEILKYVKFKGGNKEFADISCDPGVCILPHSFSDPTLADVVDQNQSWLGRTAESISDDIEFIANRISNAVVALVDKDVDLISDGGTLNTTTATRNIGGIFLNTEMLLEAYDSSIRNKKEANLGDFLKAIWDDRVNEACPLHNFIFQVNPEIPNECYVIDLPADGDDLNEIDKEIFTVEVQSDKSVVRDYQLEASIPDALKSTIAVHSQNPDSVEDLDDVTFRAFNRAISNRIFTPPPTEEELEKKAKEEKNEREAYENSEESKINKELGISYEESKTPIGKAIKRYKLALKKYKKQSSLYFEIINADENGSVEDSQDKIDDLKTTLKELQTTALQIEEFENKMLSSSAVIPLEFSMTFDGISNIIIGCLFKIREDRLPKGYRANTPGGANVAFIVFKEEQSITAGQDWVTKIGGKMILLPNKNIGKKTSGGTNGTGEGAKKIIGEPTNEPIDQLTTALLPLEPTQILNETPSAELQPLLNPVDTSPTIPSADEIPENELSEEAIEEIFQQYIEIDREYFGKKFALNQLVEATWNSGTNAFTFTINELTTDLTLIVGKWEKFRPQMNAAFGNNWGDVGSAFQKKLLEAEGNTVISITINGQTRKPFVLGGGTSNLKPNTVNSYLDNIFTIGNAEID